MTKQNIFATLSDLEEEIQSMLSLKQPVELDKEESEKLKLDWVKATTLSDKQFTLAFPFISHYLSGDYKWLETNTDDYYFAEEFDFYIPFGQTNIPQNEPLLFMKMGNTILRENQSNGELFVAQEVCFDYDEIVRLDVSGKLSYMEIGEEAVYIDTLKSYQVLRNRNTIIFSIMHQLDTILEEGQLEIDREQYDSMCETYLVQILKEYKELKRIFESYDSKRFSLIYENYDDILSDIETVEEMLQELYKSEAILYIGEIEHLFIPIEGKEFFKTKKVCNNKEQQGTVGEYIDKFLLSAEELDTEDKEVVYLDDVLASLNDSGIDTNNLNIIEDKEKVVLSETSNEKHVLDLLLETKGLQEKEFEEWFSRRTDVDIRKINNALKLLQRYVDLQIRLEKEED